MALTLTLVGSLWIAGQIQHSPSRPAKGQPRKISKNMGIRCHDDAKSKRIETRKGCGLGSGLEVFLGFSTASMISAKRPSIVCCVRCAAAESVNSRHRASLRSSWRMVDSWICVLDLTLASSVRALDNSMHLSV